MSEEYDTTIKGINSDGVVSFNSPFYNYDEKDTMKAFKGKKGDAIKAVLTKLLNGLLVDDKIPAGVTREDYKTFIRKEIANSWLY